MENNAVFENLLETTIWEDKALAYIQKYGKRPSGLDISKIYRGDPNLDLNDHEKQKYMKHLFLKNFADTHHILHEYDCFQSDSNIELSKVDRFVDQLSHIHEFFEVECVLKGHCIHIVEKQSIPIKAGDIVIVPPKVEHKTCPDDECIILNLKIRKRTFDNAFAILLSSNNELSTYLSRTLYSTSYRSSLTFHCGDDDFLKSILLSMYGQQIEQKQFYSYMLEGMTLTFFSYLIQNHSQNIEISNFVISSDDRMSKIITFIHENYKIVTLGAVAKKFYITEPYLSSIIKKEIGSTFSSLLQEIKMQKAKMLLLTTDLKIDDVCQQSGYKDSTQFIKTFKKYYGLSPQKYRLNTKL